jgi:hypothetical protein
MFVDVEPPYSGITEIDASKLNMIIVDALEFGDKFMQAGGTVVCKTLISS